MANIRSVTHALKSRQPGRPGLPQNKSTAVPRPENFARRSAGKTPSKTITNATTKTITRAVGTSGGRSNSGSGGRGKSVNKAPNRVGVTRSFIGTKRMRKLTKDNIRAVTKGDIRRLARRGGVKRISGTIYDDIRNSMKSFLEMVLKDTCDVVEHAQRKTVTVTDIIFVLRRIGRPIYGFDHLGYLKSIKGSY